MATGKLTGRPFQKGNPGRKPGSKNKRGIEVRELARRLVEDEVYAENLQRRLRAGNLSPPMETLLWHYAYGKPMETVDLGATAATALSELVKRAANSNG